MVRALVWSDITIERTENLTAGIVIPGLYENQDDCIDISLVVEAANQLLAKLDDSDRAKLMYTTMARERRAWSNPEIYVHRFGLRLDETTEDARAAVLHLLEVVMSAEGFRKALTAMLINGFLGHLHNGTRVLNRWSYNFLLFGRPSKTQRWGFLLFGHHLDISVSLQGSQIMITPTFIGAEPNVIDEGPLKGTRILDQEEQMGLAFMQSLPPPMRKKAQIYSDISDPSFTCDFEEKFPHCRWNPADQRHLCGAFQDNRIVPYEGICLSELEEKYIDPLLDLVSEFILYLPAQAKRNRLAQVRAHIPDTHFCWIGGFGKDDAFYFRIQSPVIICEFDHHSGVFLLNEKPAKFHIHTIVRSPNGGDYGYALGL